MISSVGVERCSSYDNVATLPGGAGFIATGYGAGVPSGSANIAERYITRWSDTGAEMWTRVLTMSPIAGFDLSDTLEISPDGNPLVLNWDNTVTMLDVNNPDSQKVWNLDNISTQILAETGQSVLFDTITHLSGDDYLMTGGDGFVAKVTLAGNAGDPPSDATLRYYNQFAGDTFRKVQTGFGAITLGGSQGGGGYLARIVDTGSGFDMTWNLPFGNTGNDVVSDFYQTSANSWIVVGQTNSPEPSRTSGNTFASQHAWVASVGFDPNRNSLEGISEAPMSLYDIGGRGWNISFDSVIVNLDPDRVERGVSTGFVDDITIIATLETWDEEPAEPGDGLILQVGANEGDILRVYLESMDAASLGLCGVNTQLQEDASRAITYVHEAINKVSLHRAYLGATQNRLEFKINNLDNSVENLSAAESRIRDAEIAKEMTAFMKNNILIQASTSMFAQANSIPNAVLQLLGG